MTEAALELMEQLEERDAATASCRAA